MVHYHRSAHTQKYPRDLRSNLYGYPFPRPPDMPMHWPANSPDLNPIENVWRIHHTLPRPKKVADLKAAIIREWNEIEPHEIERSFPPAPSKNTPGNIKTNYLLSQILRVQCPNGSRQ